MDETGGVLNNEETVDELRKRLNHMKKMMNERRHMEGIYDSSGRASSNSRSTVGVIDGSFLSWVFGTALAVILSVSAYAFYNLYHAILKKFPSEHTEL